MSAFSFDETTQRYTIVVKQVKQYQLATYFVGQGLSFRMAAFALQDAKDITNCAQLGHCSEGIVTKYCTAVAFQHISALLSEI
jgi:hypothetical protein